MLNLRLFFPVIFACAVFIAVSSAVAEDSQSPSPESVAIYIDECLDSTWRAERLAPSRPCLDHEYLRRVCLDVAGVIPSEQAVSQFLANSNKDKRQAIVEELLQTDAYARYAAVTWLNLLIGRGKNEDALTHARFRDWLYVQFKTNKGFDETVRHILTANGTPLEEPAVVWSVHHNSKPEMLAGEASRLFLGTQIQCAQCHDHPFEKHSQEDFYGMAAFFARTSEQNVLLTKRVADADAGEIRLGGMPEGKIIAPRYIDGTLPDDNRQSRRRQLANWIVNPANEQFARAITNRVWARMLGSGLVNPVDDFNPQNRPVNADVLERLSSEFIRSGYDMKFLVRVIVRTRAYQLSSRPSRNNKNDETYFSKAQIRRLTPEQLVASVVMSTSLAQNEDTWDNPIFRLLMQIVVNDFTFVFDNMDEITEVSEFRGTIAQALMMMNGQHITNATKFTLLSPNFGKLTKCATVNDKINLLFRATLSRPANATELKRFSQYFQGVNRLGDQLKVCEDIYWALLNCSEFTFNY